MEKRYAPVSRRALEGRLRRYLEKKEQTFLHKSKGRMLTEYGAYYTVDFGNHINGAFNDLEEISREKGVLKEWERLAD